MRDKLKTAYKACEPFASVPTKERYKYSKDEQAAINAAGDFLDAVDNIGYDFN